ncbi:MAG: hypothetical protein EON90_02360 [Brevundimonas sp.]|nr:MAG: hypothetical protein EON90_02360 [Brevundimonas sp.]
MEDNKVRFLNLAAGAVALASCAPAGSDMTAMSSRGDPSRCFRAPDVDNFRRADSDTVYVRSRQGYGFELTTPVNCTRHGLGMVVVELYVSTSPWICAGDRARLRIAERAAAPQSCIVQVSGPVADTDSLLPTRNRCRARKRGDV